MEVVFLECGPVILLITCKPFEEVSDMFGAVLTNVLDFVMIANHILSCAKLFIVKNEFGDLGIVSTELRWC